MCPRFHQKMSGCCAPDVHGSAINAPHPTVEVEALSEERSFARELSMKQHEGGGVTDVSANRPHKHGGGKRSLKSNPSTIETFM